MRGESGLRGFRGDKDSSVRGIYQLNRFRNKDGRHNIEKGQGLRRISGLERISGMVSIQELGGQNWTGARNQEDGSKNDRAARILQE